MNAPTRYPPQKGVWTLIAPDGRKWEGSSGLEVAGMEQRERIPASVALERIYRALDDESPTQETRTARRERFEEAAFNLGVMRTERPEETRTAPEVIEEPCAWCNGVGQIGIPGANCNFCGGEGVRRRDATPNR